MGPPRTIHPATCAAWANECTRTPCTCGSFRRRIRRWYETVRNWNSCCWEGSGRLGGASVGQGTMHVPPQTCIPRHSRSKTPPENLRCLGCLGFGCGEVGEGWVGGWGGLQLAIYPISYPRSVTAHNKGDISKHHIKLHIGQY